MTPVRHVKKCPTMKPLAACPRSVLANIRGIFTDIDETIGLLETAKVPRYWAIVQAFADSFYRWPTAEELHEEFRQWRVSSMEGYIVFSWAYSGDTLANHPDLVTALMAENGS